MAGLERYLDSRTIEIRKGKDRKRKQKNRKMKKQDTFFNITIKMPGTSKNREKIILDKIRSLAEMSMVLFDALIRTTLFWDWRGRRIKFYQNVVNRQNINKYANR